MERILVYHTAAIGDSVLATPVSVNLKKAFPNAKITCVTHESLIPLLRLCPAIDDFIAAEQPDLRSRMQAVKPELTVDLSGSTKSFLQTLFLPGKTVRYRKREHSLHAVDNYLETISSVCQLTPVEERFPTFFIAEPEKDRIRNMLAREHRRLLALVPGVGALRPHRAWPEEQWSALAKNILWEKDHALILIGGMDERTLCSRIAERAGEFCFNLAGKLNLAETAAAHISIAVGTPVVGLYGPTTVERSGPYGGKDLALSASDKCECSNRKSCKFGDNAPGKCMNEIRMKLVYGNLISLFPWNRI
jgi:ADP-heptose:LPS heptosyltransferase